MAASKQYLKPNESVDITATCSTQDFIANGVFLDTTVNSGATLLGTSSVLKDGPVADLGFCDNSDATQRGLDVTMGSLLHGDSRSVTYQAKWATEGAKAWAVEARCDKWTNVGWFAGLTVDGTAPTIPTNLHSTTHTPGVWSNDPNIIYAWTAATDALSGVDGYALHDGPTNAPRLHQEFRPVHLLVGGARAGDAVLVAHDPHRRQSWELGPGYAAVGPSRSTRWPPRPHRFS